MSFREFIKSQKNAYPVLGGHRGCICERRENTIGAFEIAQQFGAKYIEIDVQLTADHIPVIFHDIRLEQRTPLKGLVHDYTCAELKAAFEMITLEEAVEWCKEHGMYIALEIKCVNSLMYMDMPILAKAIVDVLVRNDFVGQCMPFSINHKVLRMIKEYNPEVEIGLIISFIPADPVKLVKDMDAMLYLCYMDVFAPGTIEELQKEGILVGGSVTNTPEAFALATASGVDMIESDHPEILQALMVEASPMKASYHNHSRWCRHALGEIEEYIQSGIKAGLEEIAITEHVPHRDNLDPIRMQWEDFIPFNTELDRLVEVYKAEIKVIKGFECEYFPDCMETYQMFKDEYGYEIFILGHHRSCDRVQDNFARKGHEEMRTYGEEVCAGLRSGFFTFLAHPDVPLSGYIYDFDDVAKETFSSIFAICEELDIPVEFNANGLRGGRRYPCVDVYELSKNFKLRYLVNGDAHAPGDVVDEAVKESYKILARLGIEPMQYLQYK